MSEIGNVALLLALVVAVYAAITAILGARQGYRELLESGRNGILAVCILVTVAAAALLYALITRDFQVKYVFQYTDRALSLPYTVAAFYAGNAGSLLFWSWALAILGVVVVWQHRRTNQPLMPYVYFIIMVTQAFFLVLLALVANPFERGSVAPQDGNGLNPLLENPGMVLHPPTLLLGYVGLTVPYAFAMAALISRRLGDEWIITVRRWTLLAWLFLGVGNLVGAQWAYVELGWGGYWAWDPVENAGLMPWLMATAFLHSVMIQRRRGMLKVWNMVLIILTFNLSIFGTFLTRSGVLSSVHTFGLSSLGPAFTAFIVLSLVGSFALLLYRWGDLRGENELDSFLSRESTFLLNNLVLVGSTFAIFWGTIFPLVSEAVRGVKVTVGPPFFNQVNGPIFMVLIVLMGVCPLIGWRRASPNNLWRNFLYPLMAALAVALALVAGGVRQWYAVLAFALCAFVIATILLEWLRGIRARHRLSQENYLQAFGKLIWANRPRYGGYVVHLSIILIAIGIVGSSFFKTEQEVTLRKDETTSIGQYVLRYDGLSQYTTQNKTVVSSSLSVFNSGRLIDRMVSEKYFHRNHEQPVTEVAIRTTPLEDLYVILGNWGDDGSATFKLLINPLVVWIWIGVVILLAGTTIVLWPDRRERRGPVLAAVEERR